MRNPRLSVIDFNRIRFLKLTDNAIVLKSKDIKGLSIEQMLTCPNVDNLSFAFAWYRRVSGTSFKIDARWCKRHKKLRPKLRYVNETCSVL